VPGAGKDKRATEPGNPVWGEGPSFSFWKRRKLLCNHQTPRERGKGLMKGLQARVLPGSKGEKVDLVVV